MIARHLATLYIAENSASQEARRLLKEAGIPFEVKTATVDQLAAYGAPVLYGLSNRFEGVEGVRIFIENAKALRMEQARSE